MDLVFLPTIRPTGTIPRSAPLVAGEQHVFISKQQMLMTPTATCMTVNGRSFKRVVNIVSFGNKTMWLVLRKDHAEISTFVK